MPMTPDLEAALRSWLAGYDHLSDEDLTEGRYPADEITDEDVALVLAARAALSS
jgi:hypothetical protein